MFRNTIPIIRNDALFPQQEHFFAQLVQQVTPATVFIVFLAGLLVANIFSFLKKLIKRGKNSENKKPLKENLPPFFNSLKLLDREFWFREELISRQRMGIKRMEIKSLKKLMTAPEQLSQEKRLRGV